MTAGLEIVNLAIADEGSVRQFFARIPEGDRTFFRDDVLDPATLAAWLTDGRSRRLVATTASGVHGLVAVVRGFGWTSHVAELRVVVDPARRRQGLGRALARRGLLEALDMGLSKLVVEVAADDEPSLAMFVALGFEPEAILKGQIRDRAGDLHDLLVMAHVVDEMWAGMSTVGVEDAFGDN